MSDKLLLLTYFIFGVVVIYNAVVQKDDKKAPTFKTSIWVFIPVWVMLIIQMWLNMWHGIA